MNPLEQPALKKIVDFLETMDAEREIARLAQGFSLPYNELEAQRAANRQQAHKRLGPAMQMAVEDGLRRHRILRFDHYPGDKKWILNHLFRESAAYGDPKMALR